MDDWEKEHITKNLSSLLKLTRCNTELIAELTPLLSSSDVDQLETKLRDGGMAQSKLFYDIAVTRHGMYETLTKALLETKQTGAFQILLQGAMMHRPGIALGLSVMNPESLRQALKGFGKHALSCLVNFQSHELPLKLLLQQIPEDKADFLVDKCLTGELLAKVIDNRRPTLFNNSVPPDIPYYVARRLTSRHRLKPEIFTKNSNDIFVVKNIQLHELSRLSGNEGADVSTNQTESLTRRFIVLIYEQDYEQICKITSDPIHLLEFSNEQFTWIKSQGDLLTLQSYINDSQTDLTEDEFVDACLKCNYPICISDTPGMGKTVLLASLANNIMRLNPQRHVRYMVLRELVPLFEGHAPENIDSRLIIHIISEQASEFEFGKKLMKELLNSESLTVEILFDGFDEVFASQVKTAKNILRIVLKMKSVRIYVATRPHMRDELEKTLGVLGYNIKPFETDEQIKCLKKCWIQEEPSLNITILEEYARDCLVALEKNMKDSEREIAGIPLQCRMLAEVYQEDAIKYSKANKVSDFETGMVIRITSIFDMYRKLITMRFKRISKDGEGQKLKSVTFAHMQAAVQLLFPECDEQLKSILTEVNEVLTLRELCEIGILEKKIPTLATPRFIHRTFAEYFLGLFVVRMLHYHEDFGWQFFTRNTFLKFLYQTVFLTTRSSVSLLDTCGVGKSDSITSSNFNYSVICYFINAHLKILEPQDHAGKSPWTKDASKLYDVLAAAITHDFPAVFHQLSEEPTTYPNLILDNNLISCLALLCAKYSNLELFKMMHEYLLDCFKSIQPQFLISSSPEFEITPLHIAVERGDYGITDFIIKYLKINDAFHEPKYVTHCCIAGSKRDKPATVDFKKQIIKLTFDNYPHWINETMPDGTTPLLQDHAHLELLQTLLDCGADVNAINSNGCVLHRLFDNELTPEKYYDLKLLLMKHKIEVFNSTGGKTQTPLHIAVHKIDLLEDSIRLFQWMKADFNAVDENGDSIFFYAVRAKRSLSVLQKLLEYGCIWKTQNKNHENVFHIAANHGYYEAFEFLLECHDFELSCLNSASKSGITPLIQALQLGKGLPLSLIKKIENKGFVITNEVASKGLKTILCNKNIMAWELNENFTNVTCHLMQKGGVLVCRNGESPWKLEATQKNMHNIAASVKCNASLCMELRNLGVLEIGTPETVANENCLQQCHPKLLADLKNIGRSSIDEIELPQEESFESLYQKLIIQENSFERLCVSLITCKQIQTFGILKQCLQSELQESIKFVTPVKGLLPFIHSKYQQVVILRSPSIDLSTTRLRNTIDPDLPVIQFEDLSIDIHETNLLIYRCESAESDVIQALNNLEMKVICVCLATSDDHNTCLTLFDDMSWDDLSTNFQDKLSLYAGVRAEICKSSLADPVNLKNESLVAFIFENEQLSTEIHRMIEEFSNTYLNHEPLSWIPEQVHGEITPLHIAVKVGYIATTKFLLSSKSQVELQQLKYLIHFCVAESSNDDSDTILRKETIIGLLIKKNKSWIDESFYQTETPPLLQSRVNEKLLDCLVKSGSDVEIALEHGKGLTVRLVEILKENGLQWTTNLASKVLTNLFCTKRIMGWELNSDFVKVADFLLEKGAQIICQNGKSVWEVEAVKANIKRIAEATLCNHALVDELEKRGFHDAARFTDSDLLYNILQTLGHKKSFEYLCTSLIACNQIKPYILLKLCLQSDGNQAAKFITPTIGIEEFLENEVCNVAVLQSSNVELSIARIKETLDKDAAVLTEADIHREPNQFKEHFTNMLVLECGIATEQTIQRLGSIHHKVICVCAEVSVELTISETCKILYDEFSWKDLSPYYKKVLKMSVAAQHEMNGILHIDYKLLGNEEFVKFIIENESSNVMKLATDHATVQEEIFENNPNILFSDDPQIFTDSLAHCSRTGTCSNHRVSFSFKSKNFKLLDESLPDGTTPLLQSAVHSKLVECLINQGADTNVQTKNGVTFLIKVLSSGHGLNLNILKLMEKKGYIISQQQASKGLSALFSSKNTKPFGLNQDFTQILDYMTEKTGNLASQNNIWESKLIKSSLPKIIKVTQRSKKLLEELQSRGILTELKMKEFSKQSELLFKSLQTSEHHDSFAAICSSLVACNQIEPFMLLKQCFRSDITDRIMFVSPQEKLADFVMKSKHDCIIVLQSLDFELTTERIKDTIEADVFHVNDETLHDELPTTSILIYKCEKAEVVDVKRLAAFQRKIICLCKSFDDEIKDVKLYEDKITWNDLSEELKYDLMSGICDANIETIGKYSELNDDELVNFIRQNLPQFTGIEKEESNSDDKYLSKDIFQYFNVDKFVFIGISRDELNTYIKFDHKIGGTGDDIDKLDFMLIENEQSFVGICKETSYNVHLIEHEDGRFKLLKTKGKDNKLQNFIEKNPKKPKCDNIPVCICGEHGVGSGNLIWNVFHMYGKGRTYWINILDIIEQMEICDFKLGDSLTLSEVTKLFNSKFSGLNSLECWRNIRKPIGGAFLRNHLIQTAIVIEKLLKYIRCDEGERKQLIYIAVKMLFPKLVRHEVVLDLEKYFECGVLKYVDSSPVFAQNDLTWYFMSELLTSYEDIVFVNIAELTQDIFRDCIESTEVNITHHLMFNRKKFSWFKHRIKSFRFVNATFFTFFECILSLHFEMFSSVLREFPDKTEDFWTKWLNACVLGNHFNLLKLSINSSISMKQTESELENLLCLAVKLADIPVIDLLMEQFPLHNKQNAFGFEVTKNGLKVKISILHIAALRGSYSVIHHLITNKRFNQKLRNKDMRNIISYCVYDSVNNPSQVEERKLIIRLLFEHDSTLINDKSEKEIWIPPLFVPNTHVDLVKFLINFGVDCNVVYKNSKNILHFHAEYMTPEDYHKLAETLFARRNLKIFNAVDKSKNTPLYYAVSYIELLDKTMELFSAAKANFNAEDQYGDTVLIKAVYCNSSLRVLETLIHYGADFTIQGKYGYSVLHMAADSGNVSALRYFITLGCEINVKNVYDNTPLHVELKHVFGISHETVKILIEHGADVNSVNKKGETPISLAENRGVEARTVAILKNAASHNPK
ncbi:unnamed protein product [Orchesella dallaii]|uniref:Uncharacterized protein n=1 Tax=Orchesella dallaii TaxID=48710 RepID=A0ABP1S0Y2_9HEXA